MARRGVRSFLDWWKRAVWGRHRVLVIIGIVVVVFAASFVGYAVLLNSRLDHIDVRLHASRDGGTTYLIIGSDSRAGVAASQRNDVGNVRGDRADIVLLLRVPDGGGTPRLLSIPRDLLVLGEDLGLHRLTLTWLDGPQATVDALCQSLGIGEDHLVRIDLAGFSDIVDAVDGVDIDVERPTRDTVLNFEFAPGHYHLDGQAALLYVRARHLEEFDGTLWRPLPNQRAEQAQLIMKAVARDAKPSLLDPIGTHQLLWSVSGSVAVDENTGLRDLWALANEMRTLDTADDVELPAILGDGPIPFAQLAPGAHDALLRAGAGGPGCRRPALPEAST